MYEYFPNGKSQWKRSRELAVFVVSIFIKTFGRQLLEKNSHVREKQRTLTVLTVDIFFSPSSSNINAANTSESNDVHLIEVFFRPYYYFSL